MSGIGIDGWPTDTVVIRGRDREIESLRSQLAVARARMQNLLHRQHGDQIIMNPDEYLRATLSLLDAFLAADSGDGGEK